MTPMAGAYQQTTSGLSVAEQDCYELEKGCYSIYGFEYAAGSVYLPLFLTSAAGE
jgi:hypothetical protein